MIYAGKNILNPGDTLVKMDLKYLYNSLRNPKPNIAMQIQRLQTVISIDSQKYQQLKRQLPYITFGCFNPHVRKTENFAFIEYFILDIDSLAAKGLDMEALREMLKTDTHVVMLFASQGGDGLKIIFRLSERCYDEGLYSVFVKEFARLFFLKHNVEQFVDSMQSDVTYSCYISIDPDAYYNPEAEPVEMSNFIDIDNPAAFFELKKQQAEDEKLHAKTVKATEEEKDPDPGEETMSQIKTILMGDNYTKKQKKNVFVPKELEQIMEGLQTFLADHEICVYEMTSIPHAKKLRCRKGADLAEVNIFYTERGYNVVQSPRCCTSPQLNDVVSEIIRIYLKTLTPKPS